MKKFSKVLLFILILPLCFSFSACKKKSGNETPNNPATEQPGNNPDGGSSDGGESGGETITAKYTISFVYNLPAGYDFLLTNNQIQENVGTTKSLENIIQDQKLMDCFDYWSESGSSEPITSVTSDTEKTINLIGNWKVEDLKNYYYSDGLSFSTENSKAYVDGYTGVDNKIIIPKYYKNEQGVERVVAGFVSSDDNGKGVFEDRTIEKLIINNSSISVGNRTFKNCTLPTDFDFSIINHLGVSSFENSNVKNVTLSSKLNSVSESAFANCSLLELIDLGGLVNNVSSKMFYNCPNLVTITGAESVTDVESYAFANCPKIFDISFLGSKLSRIASYAFENCLELSSLSLPSNIRYLGQNVFSGCNKLTEISIGYLYQTSGTISSKLAYFIGSDIVVNITKINIIGDIFTTIQKDYFSDFVSLKTFDMGNSVTKVADYAFEKCGLLDNIIISQKIKEGNITYKAFFNTKFLAERTNPILIENSSVILYVPDSISGEYTIPSTINKINESAFYNKSNLTKITIPSSVASIGKSAFESCANLEEVVFEENENLKTIEKNTFCYCYKLKSINLMSLKNLTTIGENAFIGAKIDEIKIPASLTTIDLKAFFNVKASKFVVEDGNSKFASIGDVLYEINNENKPVKLISYPINKQETMFECPETVTEVKAYAFSFVQYLQAIYFSQSQISWEKINNGNDAFSENYSKTLSVFSASTDFSLPSNNSNACLYHRTNEGNVTYNPTSNSITLNENFENSNEYKYMYIQYTYNENGETKIDIVSFKVTSTYDSETKKYSYTAVSGTIQRFETSLTS